MTETNTTNREKKPLEKQNADRDRAAQQIERNGFTAEELGEQSSYDDETEIARRMRRGDESKGDPDERDLAGAPVPDDSPDISVDKKDAEE